MEPIPVYRIHLKKCRLLVKFYWQSMIILFIPIICLPIMAVHDWERPYRCMYLICVMAIYWVTEALPLAITSIIPMAFFPLLGILDANTTCTLYMKNTVIMFMGGLIIALALEYCNLHKRIALRTVQIIGCSTARLSFGLICVTCFISFWVTNTAATAMMCPIVNAVLSELETEKLCKMYDTTINEDGTEQKRPTSITRCFYLGAAYGSTIGGIGTLIGTGTNLTFKGVFESRFPDGDQISFSSWMFFCAPIAIIATVLTWVWLQIAYMGLWRPKSADAKDATIGEEGEAITRKIINERYIALGPINAHEIGVLTLFLLAVLLFFFRDPGFMPGWDSLFSMQISDSVAAVLIVILFFIFPVNYAFMRFCFSNDEEFLPQAKTNSLLIWQYVHEKVPWGLLFLLGGGFAIAEGGKQSGMTELLADGFAGIQSFPKILILLIVCLIASLLTEFTANVPVANILLPILAELALVIRINPIYLMLPAAMCCSWAFHTAVGTPPNAIISGYAFISSMDFAYAGIGPTTITLILTWLGFPTWGTVIYPDGGMFPEWAHIEAEIKTNKS